MKLINIALIVIIVLALWPELIGPGASKWMIAALCLIALIRSLYKCQCNGACDCCVEDKMPKKKR